MTLQDYIEDQGMAYIRTRDYTEKVFGFKGYTTGFTAGLSLASQAFEWASDKYFFFSEGKWMEFSPIEEYKRPSYTTTELIESYLNNKEGKAC